MNEVFIEQLVKRKTTAKSIALKAALIGVTIIIFASSLIIPFGLVLGILMVMLDVYLFKMFDLEFEYTYVRGELAVDKIMGKERRKKAASFDLSKLEIVAPADSYLLDSFKNSNKTYDFSSMEEGHTVYALILHGNSGYDKVLFEPNSEILSAMRDAHPRKINI
ncbi:DUF6106 family protein [Konateibacter massiliensis]|uniref:DUF6106 family protein n=1 Tax=Konateibacter massiliensis TaxID=2002841 RepID=UPI000C148EB3|nr:DUF6106 family protein [Konateibacter massiliensis]